MMRFTVLTPIFAEERANPSSTTPLQTGSVQTGSTVRVQGLKGQEAQSGELL